MGQNGGEIAERKCSCLFFTQKVLGRRHQAMLPMTPPDRWLFLSQVMSHVSAAHPRNKRDEINFGMYLCSWQLFARDTYQSPPLASGLGGFHSLSSTFSLYLCCPFIHRVTALIQSCNYASSKWVFLWGHTLPTKNNTCTWNLVSHPLLNWELFHSWKVTQGWDLFSSFALISFFWKPA